eukprot:scaffold74448_cov20-Tisochrysis_lutea.AAC.4
MRLPWQDHGAVELALVQPVSTQRTVEVLCAQRKHLTLYAPSVAGPWCRGAGPGACQRTAHRGGVHGHCGLGGAAQGPRVGLLTGPATGMPPPHGRPHPAASGKQLPCFVLCVTLAS